MNRTNYLCIAILCFIASCQILMSNAAVVTVNQAQFHRYSDARHFEIEGKAPKHGIDKNNVAVLSFDNTTHVFSITPTGVYEYYSQGTEARISGVISVDMDTFTFTTGLWYIYFQDSTGTLYASKTPWDLYTKAPVATLFWNGTTGAIQNEQHTVYRSIPWHEWAHKTIGTRYYSGLNMTAPIIGTGSTIALIGGTIYDEDIQHNIPAVTSVRAWRQTAAGTWTFADPATTPYITSASYVRSSDYSYLDIANNQYINLWVYATGDISKPIYTITETAVAPYTTVAQSRAIAPPNLASFEGNQELKILYRIIYKGDNVVQEITDYRNSTPLPAGGTASTSATAVTFSPYTSTRPWANVQTAITETNRLIPVACGTDINTAIFDGAPGIDGKPGIFCNISGGTRAITYDSNGNISGSPVLSFVVQLWQGSTKVIGQAWSWWTGGASNRVYGSGTASSFTPSIKTRFSAYSSNNYVAVMTKYSSASTGRQYCTTGTPIAMGVKGEQGIQGIPGSSTVSEASVITAFSTTTSNNSLDLKATSSGSQTKLTVYDSAAYPRIVLTSTGLVLVKDTAGNIRFGFDTTDYSLTMRRGDKTVYKIWSTGRTTWYRPNGTTPTMRIYTSGKVVI